MSLARSLFTDAHTTQKQAVILLLHPVIKQLPLATGIRVTYECVTCGSLCLAKLHLDREHGQVMESLVDLLPASSRETPFLQLFGCLYTPAYKAQSKKLILKH